MSRCYVTITGDQDTELSIIPEYSIVPRPLQLLPPDSQWSLLTHHISCILWAAQVNGTPVCNPLKLSSFTQHNAVEIHLNCCLYQYFVLCYCWVVFHPMDCMNYRLFIHSSLYSKYPEVVLLSYMVAVFNFVRNCQAIFQNSHTILHSH